MTGRRAMVDQDRYEARAFPRRGGVPDRVGRAGNHSRTAVGFLFARRWPAHARLMVTAVLMAMWNRDVVGQPDRE